MQQGFRATFNLNAAKIEEMVTPAEKTPAALAPVFDLLAGDPPNGLDILSGERSWTSVRDLL